MNKSVQKLLLLTLIISTVALPANTLFSSATQKNVTKTNVTWSAKPLIKVKRSSSTGPVGYTPAQIKNAYGLNNVTATGKGETIAIVDSYGSPTIQNDLTYFSNQFGLAKANLTIAYPTGKPSSSDAGWALETSLDVEWAHAIAPNANILLVVAKSTSTSDLLSAINYATSQGVQVVSNSWGGSEFSGEKSYDSYFNHTGTVYVASSGDDGSGVSWPAVSPNVLSVGGTTLNINSTGTYQSESAWDGSGGGTSSFQGIPSYQSSFSNIIGAHRGNPDISWDADPNTGATVYDTTKYDSQSGWFQIGGTSFGAPSWAALIALFDQSSGKSGTSFNTISSLYNSANSKYSTDYHDIVSGSNGGYNAKTGYDLVTGIGSPKVDKLISDINNSSTIK